MKIEQAELNIHNLISLSEAAKIANLNSKHMGWLAREGKLNAVKIGRNWSTTVEAVEQYLKQVRRTGPKTIDKKPVDNESKS